MKFDVVIGNPPFNSASLSQKTIAGTSGNTTFYLKFIELGFKLSSGIVSFVVQRTGVRRALKDHPSTTQYVLDTSKHWDYTAGYFITGASLITKNLDTNTIIQKVYDITVNKPFRAAIGGSYAKLIEENKISDKIVPGKTIGIIELPNSLSDAPIIGSILTNNYSPPGPKLLFKGLESRKSYFCTEMPSYVGSSCTFFFDSMDHANSAKLFVLNSPLIKYLVKVLSEKAAGYVFRHLREFDLSQIKTGYEYPVEFNLSQEEIAYMELQE